MKKAKKIVCSALCTVLAAGVAAAAADFWYYPQYRSVRREFDITKNQTEGITVMSSNVRCISPFDFGKKSWFYRAELIVQGVMNQTPDIIGFQEVTRYHYSYLVSCLQGYGSSIVYRDGSVFSEGCPIFYNTAKFELTEDGAFWLSETPDVPSRGWGAAFNRVCSYAILREKATGKTLVAFNTHLDHVSEKARVNGIRLILEKIGAFGGYPAVIMGDFNCRENSETYRCATELFSDAKYQTENTASGATYQNWGRSLNRENIDYFMISKTGITVNGYKVVTDTYDGAYPSDHFPIVIQISLD